MSRDDEFNQFLGAMALGVDGSSRKAASPSIMSPLPSGPPPTGESMFKKKNRHVKTTSQPIRVDTAVLRDEFARAAQLPHPRQASDEAPPSLDEAGESSKKKPGISITKRLQQKMSLVRGVSGSSTASGAPSPRPRSPSKDSTVGGLMRLGNRSAIVSKLGFGMLSKRESGEEKDNSLPPNPTLATDEDDLVTSAASPMYTPASSFGPSLVVNPLSPPGLRRSSAPDKQQQVPAVVGTGTTENEDKQRERRSSGMKAGGSDRQSRPPVLDMPKDKTVYSTHDLSPSLDNNKQQANSVLSGSDQQRRLEMENARWKEDHAAMEMHISKSVKGALLMAKTRQRPRRVSSTETAQMEALRIAALTLQANNDTRLRELAQKVSQFEQKADTIAKHANKVREELLTDCRRLVDSADKFEAGVNTDREMFKQREIQYRTANTKSENELRRLNEKVSDALHIKEKSFRDMISDAELRLKNFAIGIGGTEDRGWLVSVLDHGTHAMMELILLGGGTILSIISSVFVWIKAIIPCLGSARRQPQQQQQQQRNRRNVTNSGGK